MYFYKKRKLTPFVVFSSGIASKINVKKKKEKTHSLPIMVIRLDLADHSKCILFVRTVEYFSIS